MATGPMKFSLFIAAIVMHISPVLAKESANPELEASILAMDYQIFEEGFNKCDLEALEIGISPGLEFYHDHGGFQDRAAFMQAFNKNICGDGAVKPIRRLVADTHQVFPLFNQGELYGAIQQGDHNFYARSEDGTETITGSAAFSTLWMLQDSAWKMHRVYSYDHAGADAMPPRFFAGYRSRLFDNDRHIESLMASHAIPSMAIANITDGHLSQLRAFGNLAEDRGAPLDTIYKAASLTKPVVAMLTLKLVDEDLWSLDTPLSQFHVDPDISDSPFLSELTTRHVLSHRTGFPNWRYQTENNRLSFQFRPGTRQQYSGEGYEYLRNALESYFDMPIEQLAQRYLFDPLSMDDTSFYWTAEMSDQTYAAPHDAEGRPIAEERHQQANAAANLLTTAQDYGRFMEYVMGGAGLSPELFQEMVTPSNDKDSEIPFGLGWQVIVNPEDGGYTLQHTGDDPGIKAIAIMRPDAGSGLLILSNSENGMVLWPKIVGESLPVTGSQIIRRNLN